MQPDTAIKKPRLIVGVFRKNEHKWEHANLCRRIPMALLLLSRLYCRPRNFTESCPKARGLYRR